MIQVIVLFGSFVVSVKVIFYFLGSKFVWLQGKDKLSWRRGFKRNRYELLLKFEDGRFAFYTFYANYTNYQAADLVAKLFNDHSFVGIEENGRVCYYHSSEITKIETQRILLRWRSKGPI